MTRTSFTVTMVGRTFAACTVLMLAACSGSAPELAGTWKSERTTLTISQEQNQYKIVAVNPKGILGGSYTSEFREGRLTLKGPIAPLCGDLKYVPEQGKLHFCSEEFVRAKP